MTDGAVTAIVPHDEVLLIAVNTRTLNAASTEALTDAIQEAAANRPGVPIVIDLAKVKFAPSVALGALVQTTKSFSLDGRRIALIGVDVRVLDAITVTRLDRILDIYRTLEAFLDHPRS